MKLTFTNKTLNVSKLTFILLTFLVPQLVNAQLSGTYTIDASLAASNTNYKTFASAISDLASGTRADGGTANGAGVSASVIFDVANGTYTEQVSIPAISGVTATKNIIFRSKSGDSTKVILTSASNNSGADYTLELNGANYITFSKITISRTGKDVQAVVVRMNSGASNNRFLNNRVIGQKGESTTTLGFSGGLNSAILSVGSDTNNLFMNNHIIYGYNAGIYLSGNGSSNKIIGNIIDTIGAAGIMALGQTNFLIENNLIRLGTFGPYVSHYVSYGLRLENSSDYKIIRNKMYLDNTADVARAIVFFNNTSTATKPGLIANNWIRTSAGVANSTGISLANTYYLNIYYNNIYNTKASATGSAFHLYAASQAYSVSNINLMNNNFINKGNGLVMDFQDNFTGISNSNYNNIYTSGKVLALSNGTNYATLTAYRNALKKDLNSISVDPNFVSNTVLRSTNPSLRSAAYPVSEVTDDIDGNKRKSKPDIGANEFELFANDAGINAYLGNTTVCAGDNDIMVSIKNFGSSVLKSAFINYNINDTGLYSTAWSGSLDYDSSMTVKAGTFNFSKAGNTRLKIWSRFPNLTNDQFTFNDTIRVLIRVNPPPSALTGGNKSICLGETIKIGNNPFGGSVYSWTSNPPGFTSSISNPDVSPSVTTTYYLTEKSIYTLCENSDSLVVTVNDAPLGDAGTDRVICSGQSIRIGSSPALGSSYSWKSFPAGFTSTSPDPLVSPTVTTDFILTETITATGCSVTDTVTITVNPIPIANVGAAKAICIGGNIQIGAAPEVGNTYSWTSVPAGFTSAVSNPVVAPNTTTRYILKETVPATGCSNTDTVIVTVNPLPAAYVGPVRTICEGQTIILGNTTIPGRTYAWTSKPAGFTSAIGNPEVMPNVTTTYLLTEINNATGCTRSDSVRITVNPAPVANPGAAQTICEGQTVRIGAAAVSGNTYTWRSVPVGFTSSASNPNVSPTVTTVYYLTEKIGTTSCTKTDSVKITVSPKPAAAIQGPTSACSNSPQLYRVPKVSGNTYQWTINGGIISTSATADSVLVNWNASATSATIKVVVTTASACKDSSAITSSVRPAPSPKWTAVKVSDKTFRFMPSDSTLSSYAWSFGDGGTSASMKPTHTFTKHGNYKIRLIVTNSTGCTGFSDSTFSTTVGINEASVAANNISIYPNPFQEATTLSYTLTERAKVQIMVYDITGKEIANIADATQTPGEYKYNFNASQYNAGAGIYMVKMVIGDKFITRQIVNLK